MEQIVFDRFEDIEPIQDEWDKFIESIGGEIFLTFDWCKLWWKHYGNRRHLKILIFKLNNKIIGILPVFIENIGFGPFSIRIVKIVGTDFTPITISMPIDPNYFTIVIPAFINQLNILWSWDVMHVGELSGSYKLWNKFSETLNKELNNTYGVECYETDVQTYYDVANSLDEQLKVLSTRQRTKTKRVYKQLKDKGIILKSIIANEHNYMFFLDAFIDMHQAHWHELGFAGHFVDWPKALELHKDIASVQFKYDRLRILKILLNDQCIGYEYIYKFGNTYFWFLSARTDLNDYPHIDFHRIAFGEKINHAIIDKVKWIDAMRGYYEYKLVMGGRLEPIHSIFILSNKVTSNVKYMFFRKLAWMLNISYLKIWRRRVAPKLRIKPKPLLNLWIKTNMFSR